MRRIEDSHLVARQDRQDGIGGFQPRRIRRGMKLASCDRGHETVGELRLCPQAVVTTRPWGRCAECVMTWSGDDGD